MIKIFQSAAELKKRENEQDLEEKRQAVLKIINRVRKEGDKALFELTKQFDKVDIENLKVGQEQLNHEDDDSEFAQALKDAYNRIYKFHQKQLKESWFYTQEDGTILGQKITPLDRIGIYVPGGTAAYPSSVLMNAVPAQVAGVKEIVMATPPNKDGDINPNVLLAAKILGIKEIYLVGGAQAIAALAYGTETIKPVDKIVGPGNIYVALAKREVFGQVGIDMIAGPSEITIIADKYANSKFIAADLLSQAEHDTMASSVLITDSLEQAKKVQEELEKQLQLLPRKEIAKASIEQFGGIITVNSLEQAFEEANKIAPEHLELLIENPFEWLPKVKHAGAIFLGSNSSEPVGDYFAGPNHVLPTSGTARFSSPLNVDDFMKKSSIISYSREALTKNGKKIITLAENEGLDAHASAVKVRLEEE